MSRPSWSVPNQCVDEGGCSALAASVASGSKGASQGPATAAIRNAPKSANAAAVTGFSPST
jgi:hypothetical protein